jgi:cysteine desulfurase
MDDRKLVYFDNNATTRVAPEVVEAMTPYLTEHWGNPSSLYHFGSRLAKPMDEAREKIAALIHAEPKEIVFTSCGTESNNTAIHSALESQPGKRHIVTTAVEHSAVLNYCQQLSKRGYEVTFLPVDGEGKLDPRLLDEALRSDTAVVSVMLANNETGVMFPVAELAGICHARGVLLHTDAVQAPGKVPLDVKAMGVDFLSLSAHKLHAPKGIGVLYIKLRSRYEPLLVGGHQERGRRGGTENVAGIVGFGRAAELAMSNLADEGTRVRGLRDRLESFVLSRIAGTRRNGAAEPRLPNTANLVFEGAEAEAMLLLFDQHGICASSGSACTTGSLEPSHVLTAMGLKPTDARSSIRFSLGIYNTDEDIDSLEKVLPGIVWKLRYSSP